LTRIDSVSKGGGFYKFTKNDTLVKNEYMLGFVPQPNLQVTVINQHPSYSMGRLIANPIFYERIKDKGKK